VLTKRIGPFLRCQVHEVSTGQCNLSTALQDSKAINYSITSACSTFACICIGQRAEQIMTGKQGVLFCGGGEEAGRDAVRACLTPLVAMSSKYNDTPTSLPAVRRPKPRRFLNLGGRPAWWLLEDLSTLCRGARRCIAGSLTGLLRPLRWARIGRPQQVRVAERSDGVLRCHVAEGRKVSYINETLHFGRPSVTWAEMKLCGVCSAKAAPRLSSSTKSH